MSEPAEKILRRTTGTCPVCVERVPARVLVADGKVLLEKRCPEHGDQRVMLSRHPRYFAELMEYFHAVMPESLPQRDYILRLTARCNMKCPICLASSDQYDEADLTLDQLRQFMASKNKRMKLDLMGTEPTLRDDLAEIIAMAKKKGHITALHTNGINITDVEKLRPLVEAGLDEVHLQFDGFENEHDMVLRGQPMESTRKKVLLALEELGVATDLVVTILRGLNEDQMEKVLDLAAGEPFIKEVFYLGCRILGRATDQFADQSVAPAELIDDLEERTNGRINREDIRIFQKIYFSLLACFRVRKCLYIHHYIVLRTKDGGYRPVSDYIDLPYLEPHLDRMPKLLSRSRTAALSYLAYHGLRAVLRKKGYPLLADGLILNLMLLLGFDLSQIRRKLILIGFITACDPWIHDQEVSDNCGKGELSNDEGLHESGADANVAREFTHRRLDQQPDGVSR